MPSNSIPDIGVKLSAQGVTEVIAALQLVAAEGEAAGAEMTVGFTAATVAAGALDAAIGVLEVSLGAIVALLPAITFAAAVAGMTEMVSKSLDTAEAIGKLSQKTGGSVENLSVLAMVAGDVGVDMDALSGALVKLAKNQQEASNGSAKQRKAFQDLGISIHDLQTLDPVQLFFKVAQQMDKMADGPRKTADSIATLGKAGAALIPVLDRLGGTSLKEAYEKAQQLGLILDQDTVNAARAAKEGFREMGDVVDGLATRLTAGLAPALVQAVEDIATEFEGHGVDAAQTFGVVIGKALKYATAGALDAKSAIVYLFRAGLEEAKYFGSQIATISKMLTGGSSLEEFQSAFTNKRDEHDDAMAGYLADLKTNFSRQKDFINTPPPKRTYKTHNGAAGATGDGTSTEEDNKLQDARAKYMQAREDNELAILKAGNMLQEEEDKRRYDAGLLTLDEYYNRRRDRIQAEYTAELQLLEKKREDALGAKTKAGADKTEATLLGKVANNSATPEDYKRLEEAEKAEAASKEAKDALDSKLAQNQLDRGNAKHALSLQELEDLKKLQEAAGDKYGAEETGLAEDIQKYRELLTKLNQYTPNQQASMVADFKVRGQANIDFGRDQQQAAEQMEAMNEGISAVKDQASSGAITDYQAQVQILGIERQRLANMQRIGDQMELDAELSGKPEAIAAADKYNAAVQKIAVSLKNVTSFQTELYNQLATEGSQDVQEFFTSILDGSKSAGDALTDLGKQFEEMIAQMITKMLLLYTTELLVGWITDGNSDAIASVTKLMGLGSHQGGGFTANVPTDKIAGVVHGQEWVATAAQTKQYKSLFTAISTGQAMQFTSPQSSTASTATMASVAAAAMASGAAATPVAAPVTIHNYSGQPATTQKTSNPGGADMLEVIIGKVNERIAGGGSTAQTIERTYGLSRGGTRRG